MSLTIGWPHILPQQNQRLTIGFRMAGRVLNRKSRKCDRKINQPVNEFYEITDEEIRILEDGFR